MAASRRPRSRQAELFPRPKRSIIEIAPTHRLVLIAVTAASITHGSPGDSAATMRECVDSIQLNSDENLSTW
jgi:hypothetical protein